MKPEQQETTKIQTLSQTTISTLLSDNLNNKVGFLAFAGFLASAFYFYGYYYFGEVWQTLFLPGG